jgi:FkbM family methyltransferase
VRSSDLVIDAGGYRGDWAAQMAAHYGCRIIVVEPVSEFYQDIVCRFAGNDRIQVLHAALGRTKGSVRITVAADSSSIFGEGPCGEIVPLQDVAGLVPPEPAEIGCLKLNIEGAEYDVLERLAEAGILSRVRAFLIQFHQVGPDSEARRSAIRTVLAHTHELVFDYPFVWERWECRHR